MVTTLYAGILGLLYIAVSFFVIKARFDERVGVGDGGSGKLLKRIRLHGNFIEYVPMALILMILAEQEGASERFIHAIGIMLVLGRVMHAIGFYRYDGVSIGRSGGMLVTLLAIAVAAILCVKSYFVF